jgi:hypothetical protein
MPSDCQCATAVETRTVTIEKVLNNKQATRKMRRLEEEVAILRNENAGLKRRLQKASVSKERILKDLKSKLDRL